MSAGHTPAGKPRWASQTRVEEEPASWVSARAGSRACHSLLPPLGAQGRWVQPGWAQGPHVSTFPFRPGGPHGDPGPLTPRGCPHRSGPSVHMLAVRSRLEQAASSRRVTCDECNRLCLESAGVLERVSGQEPGRCFLLVQTGSELTPWQTLASVSPQVSAEHDSQKRKGNVDFQKALYIYIYNFFI